MWDVKEGILNVCYVCVDQITPDNTANMPENVNKENLGNKGTFLPLI